MPSARPSRVLRQLLAGSTVLLLVASVTYVLGRALMPAFTSAIADITASIPTTAPVFDPQEVIDDIPISAAAVVITGAIEDHLVLDVTRFPFVDPVSDPSSKDIDIRYEGDASTLLLRATDITVGAPRTSSMTVILTTSGLTFAAQPGDCVLLVHHFEYVSVPSSPPQSPALAPTFAGELECTVAELRGGAIATFVVAFDR
ncbi:MAG: hypothetical protein WEE36_07725 [Acidimicrobiia bacterium]